MTHRPGDFNCVGAAWNVMGDAKAAHTYHVERSGEWKKIALAH